jgi:hypothetical protein
VEFLIALNLENLNPGNEPTFCSGQRLEVIDITIGSFGLLESIISWAVSSEPSLSYHRHILFALRGSVPTRLVRNRRGTSWCSFQEDLRHVLGRGPMMNIGNEAGLPLHWVQHTLITAYEGECTLRHVKTGRSPLKWTAELESLVSN